MACKEIIVLRTKPLNYISITTSPRLLTFSQFYPMFTSQSLPSLLNFHPFHSPNSFKTLSSTDSSPTSLTTSNNYNHLIQTQCRRGNLRQALQLLPHEQNPTQKTFDSLIRACTTLNDPVSAKVVHSHIVDSGFDQDSFLCTKLIDMYSHFYLVDNARKVFEKTVDKTIFVWNALLRALAIANAEEAISLCRDMGILGIMFDSFTYSYVLKACVAYSSTASFSNIRVREIHAYVFRHGFESNVHVLTTLIDCYAKFGCVSYSKKVFDKMSVKNVVTWSAIIACFASERPFYALLLFHEMMVTEPDIIPNSVSMISLIQACANLGALEQGKVLHACVLRRGLNSIVSVFNALISMYVKCGSLEKGRKVFNMMNCRKDIVSWNSMISGLGVYGFGREAISLFEEMIDNGISPDHITFVSVLGACSHSGLVQEGKMIFASMRKEYGIVPHAEHYACMVDLLGRASMLGEAVETIEDMRIEPGPTVWGALLGACRLHCEVELAERACVRLFELEPLNAGNYILLANIYAEAQMFEGVKRVKKALETKSLQKLPGCSWIEVKKKLHYFMSVDEMNPQMEQLQAFIMRLVTEMKESGYVPNTKVVMYDLDEEEKERILLGHSEKLALACGLINSRKGEVIRITKNLRLCEDCHTLTKFISKFANREIVVRDINRFHQFRDGVCSCSDYW